MYDEISLALPNFKSLTTIIISSTDEDHGGFEHDSFEVEAQLNRVMSWGSICPTLQDCTFPGNSEHIHSLRRFLTYLFRQLNMVETEEELVVSKWRRTLCQNMASVKDSVAGLSNKGVRCGSS